MKTFSLTCSQCGKTIYRSRQRINEAKKFGWKTYCSSTCHSFAKNRKQILTCSNSQCSRRFKRRIYAFTTNSFCSHSCAATVNNSKFPKHPGIRKECQICNRVFTGNEKYCSVNCRTKSQQISPIIILEKIKQFYIKNNRIPFKQEFIHASAARKYFGSWNNAILAAKLTPNPVKFAKKYFANDNHLCDSLAEKIIDDWLHTRKIPHQRSISYPHMKGYTVDFVIGNYWIEFFGLYKQHKRYDELRLKKLETIKKNNINLIELYPYHLFPKNQLESALEILLNLNNYSEQYVIERKIR